jgi:hypothetical protein
LPKPGSNRGYAPEQLMVVEHARIHTCVGTKSPQRKSRTTRLTPALQKCPGACLASARRTRIDCARSPGSVEICTPALT